MVLFSLSSRHIEKGNIVSRRYRNRRIGEFLKELDLTEAKATGIPKVKKAMHMNGSPEPAFETDDDRTFFLATLPVHPEFIGAGGEEAHDVPVNVPVNERQQWFLDELAAGRHVRAVDLCERWKVVEKTAKRDISELKKQGLIEFVGAPKKGFYRLV